jgi:hypothetical protein
VEALSDEVLREIAAAVKEQLKWTRFAGMQQVKSVILATLDTDQKKIVYDISDGENGGSEIGRIAGTSDRTVRRYWELWARLGIMESLKVRGGERYRKLFELEELGIPTPITPADSKQEEPRPTEVAQQLEQ